MFDVVILAGGLGTRLSPVVNDLPKCLANVAGHPFLHYLLDYLEKYDVHKVVLSVGYLRDAVFDFISKERGKYHFDFDFAVEETPLGTGGGIKLALQKTDSECVCVINGDTFFEVNLDELLKSHIASQMPISLSLKPMRNFERYGSIVVGDNNRVVSFKEKTFRKEGLINGGVMMLNRDNHLMDLLPEKFSFENEVLYYQAKNACINAFVSDTYFIDIGIPEDYYKAQKDFALKKMKIVLVGTAYPYRGGLASFNERLIRQFEIEGYDAEIHTFSLQYPSFLFPGKTQYSTDPAPKDLKIVRDVNSCNPFSWIKLGRFLKKEAPDILIFKFWLPFMAPCFGTIAHIVRKNRKTRVISILDNVIPHEKRLCDKALAKYFIKNTDAFIAMSRSVMDDLSLFDNKKRRLLCPHPLFDNFGEKLSRDTALKFLNLDADTRYILFFGIIRDYKGLDLLLKAFADKHIVEKNITLVIAGEFYNNEARYRKMEHDLNLDGRVIWHNDFVPDSEVKYYFCAADLVVQPYKSATQSGVTQIGFHFEKPMLVTDVGGLKEIIIDKKIGYVVQPEPEAIADAITDFFENDRKEIFEKNIVEEKKKYLWSKMTSAVLDLK